MENWEEWRTITTVLETSTLLSTQLKGEPAHAKYWEQITLKVKAIFLKCVILKGRVVLPVSAHRHPLCGVCYKDNKADRNYKNTRKQMEQAANEAEREDSSGLSMTELSLGGNY